MSSRVCVTGHIKDSMPLKQTKRRVGHRVPVVGFLLVSSSSDWISYMTVCSRPEDGLRYRQGVKPLLKTQTLNISLSFGIQRYAGLATSGRSTVTVLVRMNLVMLRTPTATTKATSAPHRTTSVALVSEIIHSLVYVCACLGSTWIDVEPIPRVSPSGWVGGEARPIPRVSPSGWVGGEARPIPRVSPSGWVGGEARPIPRVSPSGWVGVSPGPYPGLVQVGGWGVRPGPYPGLVQVGGWG